MNNHTTPKEHKRISMIPAIFWIGVVLIIINTAVSAAALKALHNSDRNTQTLTKVQRGGCDRGNQIKEQLNSHGSNIYDAMVVAESAGGPNTKLWSEIKDSVEYSPKTNCDAALEDPEYESPPAVPWESPQNPHFSP